jgi:hypothetical protein
VGPKKVLKLKQNRVDDNPEKMKNSGAKKIEKRPKTSRAESRDFTGTKRTFRTEKKKKKNEKRRHSGNLISILYTFIEHFYYIYK